MLKIIYPEKGYIEVHKTYEKLKKDIQEAHEDGNMDRFGKLVTVKMDIGRLLPTYAALSEIKKQLNSKETKLKAKIKRTYDIDKEENITKGNLKLIVEAAGFEKQYTFSPSTYSITEQAEEIEIDFSELNELLIRSLTLTTGETYGI